MNSIGPGLGCSWTFSSVAVLGCSCERPPGAAPACAASALHVNTLMGFLRWSCFKLACTDSGSRVRHGIRNSFGLHSIGFLRVGVVLNHLHDTISFLTGESCVEAHLGDCAPCVRCRREDSGSVLADLRFPCTRGRGLLSHSAKLRPLVVRSCA